MLKDIVEVHHMGGHELRIVFEDGVEGIVDVAALVKLDGIFEPLRDVRRFAEVTVATELGSICWPNGADLDPDVLYALVTGTALPGSDSPKDRRTG